MWRNVETLSHALLVLSLRPSRKSVSQCPFHDQYANSCSRTANVAAYILLSLRTNVSLGYQT